jgi:hypothetical protein
MNSFSFFVHNRFVTATFISIFPFSFLLEITLIDVKIYDFKLVSISEVIVLSSHQISSRYVTAILTRI